MGDRLELFDSERNIRTLDYSGTTGFFDKNVYTMNDSWENGEAISAHANLEMVEDVYANVLGWKSFDGHGGRIQNKMNWAMISGLSKLKPVHEEYNAFWNTNGSICYTDLGNCYDSIDIVAHEFTHGVDQYKVYELNQNFYGGLKYKNESGALNEAHSDIIGSLTEGILLSQSKTDENRWKHGEGCIKDGDSKPNRNLKAPQYRTYSAMKNNPIKDDNGGVHTYSGIFSYAFYSMFTDGRTKDISDEDWLKVFFYSFDNLSTTSKFKDAAGAVINNARVLKKDDGSCVFSDEAVTAIREAFAKCEIIPIQIKVVMQCDGINSRDLKKTPFLDLGPIMPNGDLQLVRYGFNVFTCLHTTDM